MTQLLPQCENLQEQVKSLLQLLHHEPTLRSQDTTPAQSSLKKAISPTFEIVFAGACWEIDAAQRAAGTGAALQCGGTCH